jgi:hypothetical protein
MGLVLAVLQALPAQAQASRTWVSGVGDDANPCSRTAPCKTFAGAISKTAAGGQINIIDAGAFGAVTITKSITINAEGLEAAILASATNGIIINAGVNDVVVLRGLDIDGGPPISPGLNGIRFLAGGALHVQNCLIRNFKSAAVGNGNGIIFAPTTAAKLFVSNTVITNNGTGAANGGILIKPTAASSVMLNRVQVQGNTGGILVDLTSASVTGVVRETVVVGKTQTGISIFGPGGGNLLIDTTATVSNAIGLRADGGSSALLVTNTTITRNGTGLSTVNGASIFSFKTNNVFNNTVDGAFTPSTLSQS